MSRFREEDIMNQNKKMLKFIILIMSCITLLMGYAGKGNENASYVKAATSLKAPTLTIVSRTTASVNLKYTKVTGADGYQIYRAQSKNGKYTKVKTTKELTFKDTDTTSTKVYYYKVRAYKKRTNSTDYGKFSEIKSAQAVLGKVKNVTAKASSGVIKLSWDSVSKAKSYRIYRAASKTGTYRFLGSSTKKEFTDKTVTAGKTYYYKVRAYAVMQTGKYYGDYSSAVSAVTANPSTSTPPISTGSYEQQIVDLINKERKAEGLPSLTLSAAVSKAAYKRAMEIKDFFSHTRPDGTSCFTVLSEFGITYNTCGENIAYGQKTPEAVMEAWMNSSGHRANILSSGFGQVGIGYYEVNGIPYWVQLFTN